MVTDFGNSKAGQSGSYEDLENKPSINGTELNGDKTADDLGLVSKGGDELAALAIVINAQNARIGALENALKNGVKSLTVDNLEIRNRLNQYVSEGNSYLRGAGAPSASVVPEGWNEEEYGPWTGVPQFIGQRYLNTVTNKWYTAKGNSAVSDWVQDTNA